MSKSTRHFVGRFWFVAGPDGQLQLLSDKVCLRDAQSLFSWNVLNLAFPRPEQLWARWAAGEGELSPAQRSAVRCSGPQDWPQGRVTYDLECDRFAISVSQSLLEDLSVIAEIREAFNVDTDFSLSPTENGSFHQQALKAYAQPEIPQRPLDRDRAVGALLGLAIGDALGAPLEFTERDSWPVVRDLIGGGPFHLPPGVWTDDCSMALCLADSLIACGGFEAHDLLARFVAWWRQGVNSPTGWCVDIGLTIRDALARFEATGALEAGPSDPRQAGNGSLMRLAPVVIYARGDVEKAELLADLQSRTTHPAPVAHEACRFFARLLTEAIGGLAKEDVLRSRYWDGSPEVEAIARGLWSRKRRANISSSGYCISTLEAALWCVNEATSFEDALILSANLGHDSDTVAAVTGQLAGAIWGAAAIPERWLRAVAWRSHLIGRVDELLGAVQVRHSSRNGGMAV